MSNISAFVGHSFTEGDKAVVGQFLDFFNRVTDLGIGFTWDHAEPAEPKILSDKIRLKMNDANLFIGICTGREHTISPNNLQEAVFGKNIMKASRQNFEMKTSDWILQEIGFALGQQIDIMLLLEDGVRRPGGLQGDLEYIIFKRNEEEKSFNKILEMLKTLIPKQIPTEVVSTKQVSQAKVTKDEEADEAREEPDETWDKRNYQLALVRAVIKQDSEWERHISDAYLQSPIGQGDYETIDWEASRLHFHHTFGREDTLAKLQQLQQHNPEHPSVQWYLGLYCEELKDYEKAASWFWSTANLTTKDNQVLSSLCKAALSAANHGDKVIVESALERARDLHGDNDLNKFLILNTFADVAEVRAESDNYIAFKEGILDLKPEDIEARFSLAFKYGELRKDALALYHYQRLVAHKDNHSGAWNNIGVAEVNLGFPAKAVEAYRKAQSLGDTLSMSNLAHRLIDVGFLEEAEKLCNETTEIKDYDQQIGTAISKIKTVREEEAQKENSVLDATKTTRTFYKDYAHACLENLKADFPKQWQGPACTLNAVNKNGNIELTGEFKKDVTRLQGLLLQGPKTEITVTVQYECTVYGRGLRYSKLEHEGGKPPTLLTSGEASIEGLMIVSKDLTEIRVHQKGDRENEKFYTLKSFG